MITANKTITEHRTARAAAYPNLTLNVDSGISYYMSRGPVNTFLRNIAKRITAVVIGRGTVEDPGLLGAVFIAALIVWPLVVIGGIF